MCFGTGLQIRISFNSTEGFLFLLDFTQRYLNQSSILRQAQISISIMPILAIEALNGGVYSMNAIVIHPNIPHSLTDIPPI
jgi:hypothetical protein